MRRPLVGAAIVAGLAAGGSALSACDEASSHLFTGAAYDEARDCVALSGEAIDVVEGPDPGLGCAVTCFVGRGPFVASADGAALVYLSSMCPPYPLGYATDGADPRCAKAFAARAAERRCLADGGVTVAPDASGDGASVVTDSGRD